MDRKRLKERSTASVKRSGRGLLALALSAAALAVPAAAQAAAPSVTTTSLASASTTTATLRGEVDSGARPTEYRFDYITLADYLKDEESFGEGTHSAPSPEGKLPAHPKASGDLTAGSTTVTNLALSEGFLEAGQSVAPIAGAIPAATTIASLDLGAGTLTLSKPAEETKAGLTLLTTGPQPLSAQLEGLAPHTAYRLRLAAHNNQGPAEGPTVSFATLAPPPSFGPCPNDPLRSGALAPLGHPSALLPDCRAYEQVSPLEKDGADAVGEPDRVGASLDGAAITFLSAFGMPGGEGSQTFPSFLASRSGDAWSNAGLQPPATAGVLGYLLGWTPDFAYSLTEARRLDPEGTRYEVALFLREGASGPPRQIVGYRPAGLSQFYSYVGASASGRQLFFESRLALPPEEGAQPLEGALGGASNVYAYDTLGGRLSLAAQMNSPKETEALLPKGAFAGPYNWAFGSDAAHLGLGGAKVDSYTQDTNAVSQDGALFFTASGTAQLYQRINPTMPQSAVTINGQGEEECTEAAKACTYHVSATHKTNGIGTEDGSDPAGPAPAAFMTASKDGTTAYFTSPEKLTDDANTGSEQPPAQIGRAKLGETEPEEVKEGFIAAHALGMATSPDGSHLYWANPTDGTIARAKLNGAGDATQEEADFIVPGETEAETHPNTEPGVLHSAPSTPRYVAVGPCAGGGECAYWTNTGPLGEGLGGEGSELEGGGTIGRAKLDGSGNLIPGSIEPEFIPGRKETSPAHFTEQVSNPQGIAVNSEHIYWGNAPEHSIRTIARAALGGGGVEPRFVKIIGANDAPYGLALSPTQLYFGLISDGTNLGLVGRVPLEGGAVKFEAVGEGGVRGVALDSGHLYWANQQERAIGRCNLEFDECDSAYLTLQGPPAGLAIDPAGERLYFSVNGEAPTNPGNDLYRFQRPGAGGCAEAQGCLEDLTADPTGDGAEALGVLGASEDGSYLYFVANGDLAEGASPGDCHTQTPHDSMFTLSGHCNLYLAHENEPRFIARLDAGGGQPIIGNDKRDWVPAPTVSSLYAGNNKKSPRLAIVSADGRTLSFLSTEKLTAYDNSGACAVSQGTAKPCPEYYRFDATSGKLACLTCNPTGAPPSFAPSLLEYATPAEARPGGTAEVASVLARNLAGEGSRFFFQSAEALVGADTDGEAGCPEVLYGLTRWPACQDVYEWEAPGTGSCTKASDSYSTQNEGCVYLLSPGNDARPALFADASVSGDDAFFFTRSSLVGQDQDQLFDLYDARVNGGLASQNPLPPEVCEAEPCKPGATPAPSSALPATPYFRGEGNVTEKPKRSCPKGKSPRHGKCVKKRHRKRLHRRNRGISR